MRDYDKAVLISIRPEWCEKIISGEKTIEVRKTRPKIDPPFKCYIYCTTNGKYLNIPISRKRFLEDLKINGMQSMNHPIGNGRVVGEFVCYRFDRFLPAINRYLYVCISNSDPNVYQQTCLGEDGFAKYGKGKPLYGWHIFGLKIYDEPKPLQDFTGLRKTKFGYAPYALTSPPQSWCYVEEVSG